MKGSEKSRRSLLDENMEKQNNMVQEQKVYMAEDIQQLLGLGRSKTYEFLQKVYKSQEPFRVFRIGKLFRVPKNSFDRWLYGEE